MGRQDLKPSPLGQCNNILNGSLKWACCTLAVYIGEVFTVVHMVPHSTTINSHWITLIVN
jgi:hypothetical protein